MGLGADSMLTFFLSDWCFSFVQSAFVCFCFFVSFCVVFVCLRFCRCDFVFVLGCCFLLLVLLLSAMALWSTPD